ncbi:MAG: DUF998 domain-containing protein [Kofleriaceae bacterium]
MQFVVLTTLAMWIYPGGSWPEPHATHYQFTANFLSDLGRTITFDGRSNMASSILFGIALVTIGAALIAFAWGWSVFATERRARAAGIACAILGSLSGLAFIGIGLTPWDRHLDAHNACVFAAFGALLFYVIALTIVMWRNHAPRSWLAIDLVYLACVLAYVLIIALGPRLDTIHGRFVQVVTQKAIVYISMLHIAALTSFAGRPRPSA